MKKQLLFLLCLFFVSIATQAQTSNVGIGTSTPASKVDVKGNLTIGDTYSGTAAPSGGAIIEGQVGVGTKTPGANAILDVSSTTKGMYMPRFTNAQRSALTPSLGTNDKGLLIFNTDNNRTEFWDGTQWLSVGAGAGGPPTGSATGDLTGSYPGPQIANNAVTGNKILDGTITSADLAANSVNATTQIFNVLPVGNGGTGQTSLTANGMVYGTGTSGVGVTSAPSAGQVLIGNATGVPSFAPLSGDISAVSGTGAVTLANTAVTAATYGSGTQVAQVTVDSKGRVTGATNVAITGAAPTGAASGDLTGNYPAPTIAANAVTSAKILDGTIASADLATTGVTGGTYNNVTVNTQGQVTGGNNASYLTGNQTITLSGDISGSGATAITTAIGAGKVTSNMILDGTIVDADISPSAAIQRSKVAAGTANQVLINDGSGNVSSEAQVAIARGGTNATAANYTSGKFLAYDGTRLSSTAYDQSSFATSSSLTSAVNGTTNNVAKFTGTNTVGNSQIFDNSTTVGIGAAGTVGKLQVTGDEYVTKIFTTGNNTINTADPNSADMVIGSNAGPGTRHDGSIMWYSNASASRISNTADVFYMSVWNSATPNVALAAGVGGTSYIQGPVGIGNAGPGSGLSLDVTGVVNASTGFKVAGGTPSTITYLKGNGANFVAGTIAPGDIPDLSGSYIKNSSSQQASSTFNVSGAGVIGTTLGVGSALQSANVISIKGASNNQFNIANSANSSWGLLLSNSIGNTASAGNYHGTTNSSINSPVSMINVQNDALHLGTNNTARLTIDNNGLVGIGTTAPVAKLSVTSSASNADLGGNAMSATFRTNAGALAGTTGDELSLGSIGYTASSNQVALGVRAYRVSTGTDWTTSAIVLGMDVDASIRPGGSYVSLNSNSGVGVGVLNPQNSLDVSSSFRVTTPTATVTEITSGSNITTSGGFTYVAYTTPGTYSFIPNITITGAEVLIVGGGGGGGTNGGGGGGAGGVLDKTSQTLSAGTTYNITVGTGGAGSGSSNNTPGSTGSSSIFGAFTANGGGGGASRNSGGSGTAGSGGSGGGGASNGTQAAGSGTSGQGNNGANGVESSCASGGGGGGGAGASPLAGVGASGKGGAGGAGISLANFSAFGASGVFGGGGGGGVTCTGQTPGTGGAGGSGGGGAGSANTASGTAGTANTGGGGGGSCATGVSIGGNGGSGIVVIRYASTSTTYTPSASQPTIMATSGGLVGIGTNAPTANLQVAGTFQTSQMKTVTYTNSLTSTGHFQITVSCGNGGTLLSGGCWDNGDDITGNTGTTALEMSYPLSSTTWRCGSRDIVSAQTRTLTAYAICTQ